jgi:hypothetical protein
MGRLQDRGDYSGRQGVPPIERRRLPAGEELTLREMHELDLPSTQVPSSLRAKENNSSDEGHKRSVMSALGQKQTCAVQKGMPALPPKALPYSIISIAQAMRVCLR